MVSGKGHHYKLPVILKQETWFTSNLLLLVSSTSLPVEAGIIIVSFIIFKNKQSAWNNGGVFGTVLLIM